MLLTSVSGTFTREQCLEPVEVLLVGGFAKGAQLGGARFRPHDMRLKSRGTWSWQKNPFVGTTPYNGLLALMMVLTLRGDWRYR